MNKQETYLLQTTGGSERAHRPLLEISEREYGMLIGRLLPHARRAHEIDVVVRKDGVETRYEGDWIKRLQFPYVQVKDEQR